MNKTALFLISFLLGLSLSTQLGQAAPINQVPDDQPSSAQFDTVIDDLPLMPGLHVVQEDDVLFVVPRSGRIAETTTTGEVDVDDVYDFYKRTLPHLGWKQLNGRTYMRENDILHIEARARDKVTTVRFSITPSGAK
jgi:hypothetical protein